MAATPPVSGCAKAIKLDWAHKRYGAAPNINAKFRDTESFITQYRAYQWTQGFNVEPTKHDPRMHATLVCATHPSCTFTIATKKTLFETGKLTGQTGFILTPSPHEPSHNHPAPFHPLDLDAENQRRLTLHFNDSSLSSPPGLIPLAQPSAPATLATFLATIHPSLATPHVLALLESNGLPPNETPAEDLLSLDGEVYGLFKDIHGLDAIIPAMVQDAVSRANKRRIAGDEGMDGSLDAGEQLRLEQFIQSSIEAQERKQREESRGTPMTLC